MTPAELIEAKRETYRLRRIIRESPQLLEWERETLGRQQEGEPDMEGYEVDQSGEFQG